MDFMLTMLFIFLFSQVIQSIALKGLILDPSSFLCIWFEIFQLSLRYIMAASIYHLGNHFSCLNGE